MQPITQKWEEFARDIGGADLPPRLSRTLRLAFYSGALGVIQVIGEQYENAVNDDTLDAMVESVVDELMCYLQSQGLGVKPE